MSGFHSLTLDCSLFQPLASIETCPAPTTQVSDSPEPLPGGTGTTSSDCGSPEMDKVAFKYKEHHFPQDLIQGKISKICLPAKSQSFSRSLKPSWPALENETQKQPLLSELFTKVPLREKLSLFPACGSPKLGRSRKSRECQPSQAGAKILGVPNRTSPCLCGAPSLGWRWGDAALGRHPLPCLVGEISFTFLGSLWSY